MKHVEERYRLIVDAVAATGRVSIADLTRRLKVSEMTIRRDLAALDAEGAVRRVHGGAVAVASGSYEPPFAARAKLNAEAKRLIASRVAALINDGETIILDGGTTAMAIAAELVYRDITVCTPSLRVAEAFNASPSVRLMIPGGFVRSGERSLVGPATARVFEDYRFDLYIMTVSGIHVQAGFTEWNLEDAAVKRSALEVANRCLVACDSSKFGKTAFGRICGLERADVLVTDDAIATPDRQALTAVDVELLIA